VTGPRDAGKTMMYRQLSASLEPRAKAARINAALINAPREVLAAVVQGFGLAAPADAHTQLLTDVIVAHVQDQESHQRFCVILVDDAELLDGRALEQLLSLVGRSQVRLVLFGDVRVAPLVERVARHLEVDWHELRLSGFGLNDVRAYLEWRFKQARYRGRLPFTEDQVKDVARLSDGMPGRIDQMANVLLAKLQSGDTEPARTRFPVFHRGVIVVLVVVMALAYLLLRSPATDQPKEVESLALPVPEKSQERETPGSAVPDRESPGRELTAPAASGSEHSATGSSAPVDSAPQSPTPDDADADAADVAQSGPQPIVREIRAVEAAKAPTEVVPERTDAAPTGGGTATASPAKPAGETRVAAAASGPRGPDWILQQPSDHFTLQLLSSGSAERAAAYVAEKARPEDFAVYRSRRDGKLLHVVVYGAFPSRAAAERAARSAEATAGGVKPWLRTFEQVQQAVRSTPQG